MKKITLLGGALSVIAALGFSNFASAMMASDISFSTRAEASDTETCAFFAPGDITEEVCDSSLGSYDSEKNILTLKQGINGQPNGRVSISGIENLTITATSNISTNINVYPRFNDLFFEGVDMDARTTVTLDFKNYSFTDTAYKDTDSSTEAFSNFSGSNLIFKSGTFNGINLNSLNSLKVEGGVLNIKSGVGIVADNSITVSGGEINIPSCNIAFSGDGDLSISGGVINAPSINTSGLSVDGNIEITGGEINLKSAQEPAGFGIVMEDGKTLTIDDGALTIDGFDWGISGENIKIYFNGGVTTIKNSKTHTIWIVPAADPEHDIVFGEGMGIKEDTYVFWDDETGTGNSTGIAEKGTVTIAEGYKVRRVKGWEDIDGVKSPDTGAFSKLGDKATMALVSLGMLVIGSSVVYLIVYAVKRLSARAKFNK